MEIKECNLEYEILSFFNFRAIQRKQKEIKDLRASLEKLSRDNEKLNKKLEAAWLESSLGATVVKAEVVNEDKEWHGDDRMGHHKDRRGKDENRQDKDEGKRGTNEHKERHGDDKVGHKDIRGKDENRKVKNEGKRGTNEDKTGKNGGKNEPGVHTEDEATAVNEELETSRNEGTSPAERCDFGGVKLEKK